MTAQPVNLPNAKDIDALTITPMREFVDCTALLDDHAKLDEFYEENGYLFFRNALSAQSVARARDRMLAIAADHYGLVKPGDISAKWTGKPLEGFSEEGPEFSGVSRELVEDPTNQQFLTKVMNGPTCMVPIVQYRLYPPNGPVTQVHQDGFYSPGISDYRPLWTALVPCPRNVGGLMVAAGEHKRGYFHNIAKQSPFPIPEGFIDPDSWATIDYEPGDVLIVHPYAPHAAMPNTSDQIRITLDTRVQSALNPAAFSATVKAVTPQSLTVLADDASIGEVTLSVGPDTYIRVRKAGVKEDFAGFADYTVPGMHLTVVRDGGHARLLRCATSP